MANITLNVPLSEINEMITMAQNQVALRLATQHIALLRMRVAQGIGADDRRMPSYTVPYAEYRKKKGRRIELRNLTFTGRMLADMQALRNGPGRAVVLFATAEQRVKALANQEISEWFGISPRDLKAHMRYLRSIGLVRG